MSGRWLRNPRHSWVGELVGWVSLSVWRSSSKPELESIDDRIFHSPNRARSANKQARSTRKKIRHTCPWIFHRDGNGGWMTPELVIAKL